MEKKKIILFFFIGFIALTVLLVFWEWRIFEKKKPEAEVCFKDHCFSVDLAVTPEERLKGLAYKNKLNIEEGMFFVFDREDIYSFWMKNTLIPLDIIWINSDQKIVYIKENAPPCLKDNCSLITPDQKAKYVLEISAGIVKKLGLKVGDKATIKIFRPFHFSY
ncbi:DUF192 domain-containing protein [bacterium]|nr:DUF192 domain-containing protein [bacterium]